MSNDNMFPEPRFIDCNGVRLAVYEQGDGPAMLFVHGFPELAYSWRHQLSAMAAAGYRAIAPDLRGYGRSDSPDEVDAYRITELIADVTGLLDALEIEKTILVGHDWGAMLSWQIALTHPQRVSRLITLNIPFFPRPPVDPVAHMRSTLGDDFYIVNFQDSDAADRRCEEDPGHVFDVMMRRNQIRRADFENLPTAMKRFSLLQALARDASGGDPLLNDAERQYYVDAFTRSGFTGAINWYRNWSRNWQDSADVAQRVTVPALFIGAVDDVIIPLTQIDAMRPFVDDLTIEMLEPCGHWTQQERPDDVNRLMLEWLVQRG